MNKRCEQVAEEIKRLLASSYTLYLNTHKYHCYPAN